MSQQTQTILLVTIFSSIGILTTYVVVKSIIKCTRVPMNVLERGTQDIELQSLDLDYVEPSSGYNQVDLINSNYSFYERISSYIDKWINENTFSRSLGNKEWIFKNNEQILFKGEKSCKFIQPLVKTETLINKSITMEIETFIKDEIHVPYCISWYHGENSFSYYFTDFKNSDSMISKAILDIMIKKYDKIKN
uniref:Uncharacterized protein n=1 Tax=Lactifluus piperatus TaxID=71966 RepID=A0A2Z4M939_9AGAM|nr:hypothetical protein [Lactifluus piperatus]AWX53026.1 hypothetical protein [Lactifluus piperatus]